MRLIAQYPNVGNSGHIFLVPPGQMEGALAIGEKINTQMLSLRKEHGPDAVRDLKGKPETICGQDFILASVPVNQVLSEKGAERVSHVWIALHGFDTNLHQEEIRPLQILLQDMLSKIPNTIARLGHLESNTARVIEVMELVEWSKQFRMLNSISSDEKHNSQKATDIVYNLSIKYKWPLIVSLSMLIVLTIWFICNPNNYQKEGKVNPPTRRSDASNETQILNIINNKVKNKFQHDVTRDDLKAVKEHFNLNDNSEIRKNFEHIDLNKESIYYYVIRVIEKEIGKSKDLQQDPKWVDNETNEKIEELEQFFKRVDVILKEHNKANSNQFVDFLEHYQGWDDKYKNLVNRIFEATENPKSKKNVCLFANKQGNDVSINNLGKFEQYRNQLEVSKIFLEHYDKLKQKYIYSNRLATLKEVEDNLKKLIDAAPKN